MIIQKSETVFECDICGFRSTNMYDLDKCREKVNDLLKPQPEHKVGQMANIYTPGHHKGHIKESAYPHRYLKLGRNVTIKIEEFFYAQPGQELYNILRRNFRPEHHELCIIFKQKIDDDEQYAVPEVHTYKHFVLWQRGIHGELALAHIMLSQKEFDEYTKPWWRKLLKFSARSI